jgi:signal peptidase I
MATTETSSSGTAMAVFWDNVKTIAYALALAVLLRFAVAQPFRIPSGSMQPTLEVGDYIVVTKWSYGYGRFSFAPLEGLLPHGRLFGSEPQRGDVVVFRPTPEPTRDFIKRVIGLPGDRIQMIDDVLYINGEAVERESLGEVDFENEDGRIEQIQAYRETLPNGVSYTIFDRTPHGELDNTRVYHVPEGHYFMMGDDRDNSADSRVPAVVGFVPYDNLVGPAQFIVVSFDGATSLVRPWTLFSGFRGNRFLKAVE